MVFIDGTHIKASANKKKFQKEQVVRTAKVYEQQLRQEVAAEWEKLGKKNDDDKPTGGSGGMTVSKTVSTTDPDSGMFVKGEHERQFAYEDHTACDRHGWILGVEVTAGNVNDSTAWDAVYDQVTGRFPEAKFIVMDAGYKTPWIAKKALEDSRIPILPYTRYKGRKDRFRPWDFTYDPEYDCFTCPRGQRLLTTHIWQEHLDLAEQLRKNQRGKEIYSLRKKPLNGFLRTRRKNMVCATHTTVAWPESLLG